MKQFKEHVRNSVNTGSNDYFTNIKGGFFMKKTVSIILIGIILIGMLGVNTEKVKAANGFPDYIYEGSYGQVKTNLKVRSKPTTNSDQIGLLYTDQWIYISGQVFSNDGYNWVYSSTASGYVAIDYLKKIYYASANKYDFALNYEVGDSYEFSSSDIGRRFDIRFMFKGDKIHALRAKSDKRVSMTFGEMIWNSAGEWCQGVICITPQQGEDFTISIEMLDDNWKSMKESKLKFNYNQSNEGTKIYNYNGDEFIVNENLSEDFCYKQEPKQCPRYACMIIISLIRNTNFYDVGWIQGVGCTYRTSDGKSIIKKGDTHSTAQEKRNTVGKMASNGIPAAIRLGGSSSSKGHTIAVVGIKKNANLNAVTDDDLLIIDPASAKIMVLSELKNSGYWYNGINGLEKDNSWSILIPAECEWEGYKLI